MIDFYLSTVIFLRGALRCFQKISVIEKIYAYEIFHYDFPSKTFCVTVPLNFVGETCASNNFWYRLFFGKEGAGRRESCLSVEILSHSTEELRRVTFFSDLKFSGIGKFFGLGGLGGNITIFRQKSVVSYCRKSSHGKTSVFQKIFGIENFRNKRWVRVKGGSITFLPREFVVSECRKTWYWKPSVLQENYGIESFFG